MTKAASYRSSGTPRQRHWVRHRGSGGAGQKHTEAVEAQGRRQRLTSWVADAPHPRMLTNSKNCTSWLRPEIRQRNTHYFTVKPSLAVSAGCGQLAAAREMRILSLPFLAVSHTF